MRIAVHEVSKGKKGYALPFTSLQIETGHARFVLAETEMRPTVLGLIATGRMRPDTGEVTIDGARNDRDLRRRMALVDAPEVSDPHPGVTLAAVVGEELMFAGLPATPLHARRWLEQIGFAELATQPIGTIKPSVRVRVMAELAVLRDDVEGFVLVSPDRHGGRPESWWRIATEFAERGFAVLVIVGGSAAAVIERLPEALETDYPSNATVPVRPLADVTGSVAVLPGDVERAERDETQHLGGDALTETADYAVSSQSPAASSLNDPDQGTPGDVERAPAEPAFVERAEGETKRRDETPKPQEHRVSSQSPAASSLNDPGEGEPVAEPVEATTPDDVPSTSSGTADTDPTDTANGAER